MKRIFVLLTELRYTGDGKSTFSSKQLVFLDKEKKAKETAKLWLSETPRFAKRNVKVLLSEVLMDKSTDRTQLGAKK